MIEIRKSNERGHANHGWLESFHSFSFADYYDPAHMGFRALRVINEDIVQPSKGFSTHAHKDMEIVTYVLEGELEHKDSMGTGSIIPPDDVQYMSAGRGVTHSEFNHSQSKLVHLLQIWILPQEKNLQPQYNQRHFSHNDKLGKLRLIVSPDGENESIAIRQDARIYACVLKDQMEVSLPLQNNRFAWIQLIKGNLTVNNDFLLNPGDGAAISAETKLHFSNKKGTSETEFLVFDLA